MVVWMAEKRSFPERPTQLTYGRAFVSGEIGELRYGVDVNTLEKRPSPDRHERKSAT